MVGVTPGTATYALVTDVIMALGAAILVVVVGDLPSAIGAADPVPTVKLDIGTSCVVGLQRLADDREEVEQPSLLERFTDRQIGLSLAQSLAIDVRMGDVRTAGGLLGVGGHDAIGVGQPDSLPIQLDPKRPQIHPLQDNGFGGGRDASLLEVDFDFVKLVLNGQQVLEDMALAGHKGPGLRLQFAEHLIQLPPQRVQFVVERTPSVRRGCRQALPANPLNQFGHPAAA